MTNELRIHEEHLRSDALTRAQQANPSRVATPDGRRLRNETLKLELYPVILHTGGRGPQVWWNLNRDYEPQVYGVGPVNPSAAFATLLARLSNFNVDPPRWKLTSAEMARLQAMLPEFPKHADAWTRVPPH